MKLTVDKLSRLGSCGVFSVVLATVLHQLLHGVSFITTFTALWITTGAAYIILTTIKLSVNGKTVIITGCDSGFGHVLALHLHTLGMNVVACCLSEASEGAQRLRDQRSDRLHVIQLDITNQDQIDQVLNKVKVIIGPQGSLWSLVNNAGINFYGAVEWESMESYRKVCDVNLFGTIAVTKSFLPLIRKAKGRVVTVGSVRGRFCQPWGSVYDISKYALEAFNDCLRQEMKAFDVNVCLIEPGNFTAGTKIYNEANLRVWGESMWAEMSEEVRSAYGKDDYDRVHQRQIRTSHSGNTDVSEVVDVMTEALLQKYPQARYQPMDLKIYLLMFVNTHLSEWIYDFAFEQLY